MASDKDDINVRLIEYYGPRLRRLVVVDQVLDHYLELEPDVKEQIRQKHAAVGNSAAVDLLISAVIKKPHKPGWFRTFVDALTHAGCVFAADYIQVKAPEPEVEAENDYCVNLIQLLSPKLMDMNTDVVCDHCFSEGLITQADSELIKTTTANKGPLGGARELLSSIVRGRPGWFSTFLKVLRETEHAHLLSELTGESSDCCMKGEKQCSLADEEMETDAPAAAGSCNSPEYTVISSTEEHPQEADLYGAASSGTKQMPESMEISQPEPEAAAGGPEKDKIVLRDYQEEVAKPALEGKNIIICLPTGSGKTRVAVYITKKHLDHRRAERRSGKVVVLVNKVPLVEQHYSEEFCRFLKPAYKVERVSGDCQLKISFTEIVKNNDVIVCTAQILENFLERSNTGEDEGVNLSDLTLIVIDECHHTQKGGVYNHIMMRYLKQKHKNRLLKKEQKEPVPLPQILGLTASPGVGGATKMAKAEDHILRICANLDAYKIMTGDLGQHKKEPRKNCKTIEDRKEDPFGDVIKNIMNAIHTHAELNPTSDLGSQTYEQWVVQKERLAATEENQKVRVCAEHLRQYSEGLNLSNTIRMRDAFNFLNKYNEEEIKKKRTPDEEEQKIKITDTERFLFNLFNEKKEELKRLTEHPEYENKSLSQLRSIVLQEFTSRDKARGIIFTKTRRSAIALSQWIQENSKFDDVGVKAAYVIGGGDQSNVKPMTTAEQRDVLTKFRDGEVNLLIATTVAEEGLDIAACNLVIRYGLVTNEIAMIQARGRGRAEDSSYTLVEVKNSGVFEKESVNEYRITMMDKAIEKIRALDRGEYEKRITDFQLQAIMENRVRMTKKKQKSMQEQKGDVKFSCRSCSKHVCTGEDIQIIENMHRVNVTPEFCKLFIKRENTTLQERLLDYETNFFIACKECGQRWGSMMIFRGIDVPCLHVKNFVVTFNEKKISKCTKWNELNIKFPAFDYAEHARQVVDNSDEDDD
ncbi:interferon-induced helicase C domain-containing protein 1 [Centropristis striata]|uniref:interferon-induced helicase C domain-containing protein 1 n=1 Tax=Centropristis striata TaxID=184440 RepID=UPI0027E08319|nr:interferon-induced helicase C domain-containing protein 1 [Centropristis striata]